MFISTTVITLSFILCFTSLPAYLIYTRVGLTPIIGTILIHRSALLSFCAITLLFGSAVMLLSSWSKNKYQIDGGSYLVSLKDYYPGLRLLPIFRGTYYRCGV